MELLSTSDKLMLPSLFKCIHIYILVFKVWPSSILAFTSNWWNPETHMNNLSSAQHLLYGCFMNRNKILLEKDGATNSKVQGSPLLNKCAKDKEYGILSQVFTDALR